MPELTSNTMQLYGDIELVGGMLKILFLVGLFLLMLIINGGGSSKTPFQSLEGQADSIKISFRKSSHREYW